MRRGDVFITYHTTSVATALECVQNIFNIGALYFNRIDKETRFVNSVLNSNPHRMFLLWLTPVWLVCKFWWIWFASSLVVWFNIDGHDNEISTKQRRQQYFFVNFVGCEYSFLSSLPSDLPFHVKLEWRAAKPPNCIPSGKPSRHSNYIPSEKRLQKMILGTCETTLCDQSNNFIFRLVNTCFALETLTNFLFKGREYAKPSFDHSFTSLLN